MENTKKYQPKICPSNSGRFSELPASFVGVAKYRSLQELDEISQESNHDIFYILSDDSVTSSYQQRLIPLRNSNREFLTVVILKR